MNHLKNFTSETNLLQPISGNKAKSVASPQMENIIILAYEEESFILKEEKSMHTTSIKLK